MRNLIKTSILLIALLLGVQSMNAETKRALLVGVSDYRNAMEDPYKWPNIHGANDIALLTPLFTGQGYSVTSLVDGQATHAGITAALEQLASDSQKGDIVYIHFSMHGQPFEDMNGDEEDGWDEALIPVDAEMLYAEGVYEGKNHLLDDELEGYFNQIRNKIGREGHMFVILDVDNATIGFTKSGRTYTSDTTKEYNEYFRLPKCKNTPQVTIIYACRSYQMNREVRDVNTNTWYGSLSYYIAKSMKENNTVGSDEWLDAIKTGMANNRRLRKQNIVIETI